MYVKLVVSNPTVNEQARGRSGKPERCGNGIGPGGTGRRSVRSVPGIVGASDMYEMSVCDDGGIRKLNSYERGLETAVSLPANSANTSRGRFFIARQSYTRQESWLVSNDTTTENDTPNFTNAPRMVESEKDVAKQGTVAGTTRRTHWRDVGAGGHTDCVLPARHSDSSRARRGARGAEPGSRDPLPRDHERGVEGIKGGTRAVQW